MKDTPITTDQDGYLLNPLEWNHHIASLTASRENIVLTETHWLVINTLRCFYHQYQRVPTMRILVKMMSDQQHDQKISSPYLYQLFPDGPIKQGCKIAGLPKPVHCI